MGEDVRITVAPSASRSAGARARRALVLPTPPTARISPTLKMPPGGLDPLDSTTLTPGVRLDRYELLQQIASGGMGSVWLARIEGKYGFEKLVAVKTILKRLADSERFLQMFLNEAKLAARIDHPNVTRILELGEDRSLVYFVMEWVDGAGLDVLRRRVRVLGDRFPIPLALRIAADVAAGLHAAHELKGADGTPLHVVHRDISPHNVLVGRSGVAKVIDFGVAKARTCASNSTFGALKGKLRYMPPEQALGLVQLDRRADLWALGAVLYELVEGRGLHEGLSDRDMMQRLTSSFTLPRLSAHIPAAVASILRRCLAANPDDRFATAAELRNALEDAINSLAPRARHEDVAAYLTEVLGAELDERRAQFDRASRAPPSAMARTSLATRAATPLTLRDRLNQQAPATVHARETLDAPPTDDDALRPVAATTPPPRRRRLTRLAATGVIALLALLTLAALVVTAFAVSQRSDWPSIEVANAATSLASPPPPQPTPELVPVASADPAAAPSVAPAPPPSAARMAAPRKSTKRGADGQPR